MYMYMYSMNVLCTCSHMYSILYVFLSELVQGQEYCDGILIPDKVSDGVLYNRQHSWLLFSSLALSMAQKLTEDKPKSGNSDYIGISFQL